MRMNVFLGQGSRDLYRYPYWDENEEARYRKASRIKYDECMQLHSELDAAKTAYHEAEGHNQDLYDTYTTAVDRYNLCLDEYNYLLDIAQYGPPPSVPMAWQTPEFSTDQEPNLFEPQEPREPEPEPPPVASYDWPSEVPKPTSEPFVPGEPEEPPFVPPTNYCDPLKGQTLDPSTGKCTTTPPQVVSEDWRTSGCPAGTSRLVRGGMCVSSGLVSSALTTPTVTAPTFTMGRIRLSPWRGAF